MSNIIENLQKILTSRYGKDVRQAIHDSIEDCYEDGRAGAIDLQARADIEEINEDIEGINTDLADKQNKSDANLTTTSKEIVGAVNELNQNLTNKADREAYKNDSTSEYGVRLDTESADGSVVERIQTHKDSTDGSMNIGAYNINSDNTVRDRVQLSYNGTDFIARGQLNNSSVSSKTLITTSYTQMSGHTMGTNCQAATNAVYKVGNLVIFNFVVKATGAVASGATIITLPSGFRPISGFSVGVGKANHGDSGDNNYFNIKTDGTIVTPIALKSGEYVDINCVFIAS